MDRGRRRFFAQIAAVAAAPFIPVTVAETTTLFGVDWGSKPSYSAFKFKPARFYRHGEIVKFGKTFVGFAATDINKDEWGWIQTSGPFWSSAENRAYRD